MLPTGGRPPYQLIVYFPHAGFFQRRTQSSDFDPTDSGQPLDFIMKSGRALARLVVDPALGGVTGKYFPSHARWREARSSDASYDVERAQALWTESVRMSGLAAGESPLA